MTVTNEIKEKKTKQPKVDAKVQQKQADAKMQQPIVEESKFEISDELKNRSYVKEISNFSNRKRTDEEKRKASELVEKARKEDAKLVKGVFKNLECPGGDLQFAYHAYKGEPTRVYHMIDGQSYEIPFGVAKHINRQCKYKKSKYLVDKDGNRMIGADKPIQRYQFVSNDYM